MSDELIEGWDRRRAMRYYKNTINIKLPNEGELIVPGWFTSDGLLARQLMRVQRERSLPATSY